MDNEGNRYVNKIAVRIDDNTYVFGEPLGGTLKMVAVNSKGQRIVSRYHDVEDGVITKEKWQNSQIYDHYNVADVSMDCVGMKF